MANISIFGLGYVGCVGTGCLAKLGHHVIGCDIDPMKVSCINEGLSTVVERDIDEYMSEGHQAGLISATHSFEEAIAQSEISFLCVGTPSTDQGLDLSHIMTAVHQIASALKHKTQFHIIVIRSTVPPGTNEKVAKILESVSGKKNGINFSVVSNPEFLREGIAVEDFMNPVLTVLGCESTKANSILRKIYEPLKSEIVEVEPKVAEMIKFINNSYHALKVAFANEVGAVCKQLSIDSHQVMGLFCKDTQLNISPAYFKPGFAYGGSCLPKDLKGLNYLANVNHVKVPLLSSIDLSNQAHLLRAISRVNQINAKTIGLIGLTFKAGTNDLRNSAAVTLVEALLGKGRSIKIYDRYLNIARKQDVGESSLKGMIPHLVPLLSDTVDEVVKASKLVIIAVRNPEIPEMIKNNPDVHFLDLVRIKDDSCLQASNYEGFCW